MKCQFSVRIILLVISCPYLAGLWLATENFGFASQQTAQGSFSVPRSDLTESRSGSRSAASARLNDYGIHEYGLDSLSLGASFMGGGYQMGSTTGLGQTQFSIFGVPRVTVLGGIETEAVMIDFGGELEVLRRSLDDAQLRVGSLGSTQLSYSATPLIGVNSRKVISTIFETASLGAWGFDLALAVGPRFSILTRSSFDRGGLFIGWLSRLSPAVTYQLSGKGDGLFSEITSLKFSVPFEIGQMSFANTQSSRVGYRLGLELAIALGE